MARRRGNEVKWPKACDKIRWARSMSAWEANMVANVVSPPLVQDVPMGECGHGHGQGKVVEVC